MLMLLTPKEQDRLTIFTLAELARKRRARGIQLNHPETVALICDEIMEEARAGRSYEEVVAYGLQLLHETEVMEGVVELTSTICVEALFDDGTKLIVLHQPIAQDGLRESASPFVSHAPSSQSIRINGEKPTTVVTVVNTSDHPVQVTSHMPFWEINSRMHFDRESTQGYHLDIPAGGAVRWEPGETKEVTLCPLK
jgi:urease subunit gamma/beta